MQPQGLADDLPSADGHDLEVIVRRFEGAWRDGPTPALTDFLPPAGPLRLAVLVELAHIDLELRLKAGEPARAETYIEHFPELAGDPEHALGLIRAEFALRRRAEPALTPADYERRFPQYRDALAGLDRSGDEVAPDTSAPAHAAEPHLTPVNPAVASYGAAPPEKVGKYQVVRPLGRGGQAGTYLAFDPDLRRHVVLKWYHAARTPAEQETVLREGRALARVSSPAVAPCYGCDRHGGVPFLVIEYVRGRTLSAAHAARPLSPAEAAALVARLAEGVAAVHACGLLHRDLKPANVIVGDDGRPRLVDFGLAEPLGGDGLGHVSGTLPYMAPEQARGDVARIDPRTDVYGLGAILYELLTGRPPHRADTVEGLWEAARAGDVAAPSTLNPRVPRALEAVCRKCLAKGPADRFASAAELARVLDRLAWRRGRWAVGVAAAAALVGVAVWLGPRLTGRPAAGAGELPPAGEPHAAAGADLGLEVLAAGQPLVPGRPIELTEGDRLVFRLRSRADCTVYLWSEDDRGHVMLVVPSERYPSCRLPAGQDRDIETVAVPSERPERVVVLATPDHREPPADVRRSGGFPVFESPEEQARWGEFVGGLRGLLPAPPNSARPAAARASGVVELTAPLHVKPRS
jgi:serine/threonine-protein kinase